MLRRLNVDFELREIDLRDKPREFLELSPTGKVPMLVENGLVLYESQVINDYLVDKYDWDGAYPGTLEQQYRQKVAMKQWDSIILDPFYADLKEPGRLEEARDEIMPELEQLENTVESIDYQTDNLFAFHFAPFWARMSWLDDYTDLPEWIRSLNGLDEWLDRSLTEKPIQATLPDREQTIRDYEREYVNA